MFNPLNLFKVRFKVNEGSIRQKMLAPTEKSKAAAYDKVVEKVEDVKKKFLEEFETHPVTKEIEAGNEASNISKTIIGGGNLFSFIGFKEGDQPMGVLRVAFENSFKVKKKFISFRKNGRHEFQVSVPSTEELEKITPMPWSSGGEGRSWLRGIESGLPGLNRYMYKKIGYFQKSRSLKGLQAKGVIASKKGSKFVNTRYMSKMLRTVYRRLGIWK